MRRLIHYILDHIPRPIMQRVAGVGVPLLGLLYLGRGCECPICATKRRKFLPYGYVTMRENALCPNCLSLERHRLLWLFLTRETELITATPKLLHIAPEVSIMKRLRNIYRTQTGSEYITADLESPLADIHFDIQQIPLEDEFTQVVICNHILEHVANDRLAMSELHRILKPKGWGILLSPVDYSRATTFEDDTITDPAERTKIFGQYDHRRIYGLDYAQRLTEAGFVVEQIHYIDSLTKEERQKYALMDEIIYLVRRS